MPTFCETLKGVSTKIFQAPFSFVNGPPQTQTLDPPLHGVPLSDDSDAQDKENVEANDPDGLLPQSLEARFERQIHVQEW